MKISVAVGLGICALGSLLQASPASAAQAQYYRYVNAVDNCQAFTPGTSNTIRNRVTGSENIGTAPIAVACNFPIMLNGGSSNSMLNYIAQWFTNNSSVAVTVNCTLLTGTGNGPSGGVAYASTDSVSINPGATGYVVFGATDNPTPNATDLGNLVVGTNCTLPPSVTMNVTLIGWSADNGI